MAKKVTGFLKLQVPAGAANPAPPIGPALGQRGLNIMEFCKAFNAQTQKMEKGSPIPVVITIYGDRSFTFEMKTPPMSHFLKKRSEEHTSELQSLRHLVCRLLLEKKNMHDSHRYHRPPTRLAGRGCGHPPSWPTV